MYANEIYNLNLNADLVVLSACETGMGKLIQGEGLMAMTRGFLCAGAPNIIFSLWKVTDKYSKDLMVEFYGNIINKGNYDTSLRNAKLRLIENEITAFPFYWGGFLLIGK